MTRAEDRSELAAKARLLRGLHAGPSMLVLPNAWDAASAKLFEAAGFPAIATTSGGVAMSLGFEDHENAPPDEMFAAARRITSAVSIPVTVDLEAGYGLSPDEFIERAIICGAAGFNMEDTDHRAGGLVPAEKQAERIAAVKRATVAAGVELVINARVDPLLQRTGVVEEQLEEAVTRANLYLEAGADCVYPFGWYDEAVTRALVQRIRGPINVVAWRNPLSLAQLAEIGVRRVTFATGLFRDHLAALKETAERIRTSAPTATG